MATLASLEEVRQISRAPVEIEVPASTAWPIVLAFGFTLMFAAFLPAPQSAPSALSWPQPVLSAGSAKSFRANAKQPCLLSTKRFV